MGEEDPELHADSPRNTLCFCNDDAKYDAPASSPLQQVNLAWSQLSADTQQIILLLIKSKAQLDPGGRTPATFADDSTSPPQ